MKKMYENDFGELLQYKINDIVNIHTYNLRLIGEIISINKDNYGLDVLIIKDKNGILFECSEQDIAIKF